MKFFYFSLVIYSITVSSFKLPVFKPKAAGNSVKPPLAAGNSVKPSLPNGSPPLEIRPPSKGFEFNGNAPKPDNTASSIPYYLPKKGKPVAGPRVIADLKKEKDFVDRVSKLVNDDARRKYAAYMASKSPEDLKVFENALREAERIQRYADDLQAKLLKLTKSGKQ